MLPTLTRAKKPLMAALTAAALLLSGRQATYAQGITQPQQGTQGLDRVGPVAPAHGYPLWYQDKSGLVLDFCDNQSQAELDGGWCVLLPPDIPGAVAPELFPTRFADEHFYWLANSGDRAIPVGATGQTAVASLVLALEGAFAAGPVVAGDQMVFARLRFKLLPLPYDGSYTFYTPFGKFTFDDQVAGDKIFFTQDIGLTPGSFTEALKGSIGPFLLPSATPGGAELPPIPLLQPDTLDPYYTQVLGVTTYPGNGRKYIADPARLGPITGSPLPDFTVGDGTTRNPNIFRIEGPNGFVYESTNFSLGGRIYEGPIAGKLSVDRANFWRASGAIGLNVFATGAAVQQGRIPAGPAPAIVPPHMTYFQQACSATLDPVSGAPGPPYSAPAVQSAEYQMMSVDGPVSTYFGSNASTTRPTEICVQYNGVTPDGQTVMMYQPASVTDQVKVTQALYDPDQRILALAAESSDKGGTGSGSAPSLTAEGFGQLDADGTLNIAQLIAPPSTIVVLSSDGGRGIAEVSVGAANPAATPLPTALNDTASTTEDTATDIQVALNDLSIPAGAALRLPLAGTAGYPVMGTLTLGATPLAVHYTPKANASGSDSFTYTIVMPDQTVTNPALVSVSITPVNDAPTAVNDLSLQALRNVASTANLLTNDTDPDGAADLTTGQAGIEIVASAALANLGLTAGYQAGGVVTIVPGAAAQGQYTFQYYAVDSQGVRSGNAAFVTVTVSAIEAIVPAKTLFTVSKLRWTISGTVTPNAGQLVSLTYVDGAFKVNGVCPAAGVQNAAGIELARVPVDALNTYTWDTALSSGVGVLNPSNTGNAGLWCKSPTSVKVTSLLNPVAASRGTATQALTIK